nr:MAG TPA: hypothetical protein [Caudoviricetes sp.]
MQRSSCSNSSYLAISLYPRIEKGRLAATFSECL